MVWAIRNPEWVWQRQDRSSVPLRLLRGIVVLFLAIVDQFNGVGVLSTGHWLLSLLVSHERLHFFDIIELTIRKSQMVPFIQTSPYRGKGVWGSQVEKLGHVKDVKELGTITHVEPHPVSVRLQTDWLETEQLEEVGATAGPPVRVWLVLVEEARWVLLRVVVVAVCATTTSLLTHYSFYQLIIIISSIRH